MGLIAKVGKDSFKLRTYNFPSRGNQAEDYHLIVDGEKLDATRVRTTGGGGKAYTYIKTKDQVGTNQSYWLPGALASGTAVTLEQEPEKAKPAAAATGAQTAPAPKAAAPKQPAAAAAPAPQRPAAGKKK